MDLKNPFDIKPIGHEKQDEIAMSKTCPVCNSTNSMDSSSCHNCNSSLAGVLPTYHPHAPSQKGEQNTYTPSVTKNQNIG